MNWEKRRKSSENDRDTARPEESFVCRVCGKTVDPAGAGSEHRNHCPYCLSSVHLDVMPVASPPFPLERLEELTRQTDESE